MVDVILGQGPSFRVRHGRRDIEILAVSPRIFKAASCSVILLNENGDASPTCTRLSFLMFVFTSILSGRWLAFLTFHAFDVRAPAVLCGTPSFESFGSNRFFSYSDSIVFWVSAIGNTLENVLQ